MVGALSGRALLCALAILAVSLTVATRAEALEAFDGRIQAHGFGEMQIRMLNSQFSEESDLSQWYNVFNLELEFDILPDGWGPFDLLQAYVRIEARYDCVIKRLCGTSRSVNTYGDRAKRLPKRLRDAEDNDWAGTINTNAFVAPPGTVARIEDERPSPLVVYRTLDNPNFRAGLPCPNTGTVGSCPDNRPSVLEVRDRQGFPGLDTLGNLAGADNEIGTNPDTGINDDPVNYLFEPLNFNTGNAGGQFLFTFREMQGPEGSTGRTRLMGPWLPKNFIQALGTLHTRANPFRGRVTPTGNNLQDILGQVGRDPGVRYHALDPFSTDPRLVPPPGFDPNDLDPVDPRLIAMAEYSANGVIGDGIFQYPSPNRFGSNFMLSDPNFPTDFFGGDYSGIIPCNTPATFINRGNPAQSSSAQRQIQGLERGPNCIPRDFILEANPDSLSGVNIANVGGTGELPMRPAPDRSNLLSFDENIAQGVYIPSQGLREALANRDLDHLDFNFRESERAWNRGASQQDTKELKEAYFDAEFLDSRLWLRLGLQNIVWGKTELFRTTDQFNPQDFALASLPSLEESRIALFAARAVYSLYDVGPLEDVRLEVATNIDQYEPNDLGACGEAYTIDIICSLTVGTLFHGLAGVGIAGIDRPPDPWEDIKGLEFGGRIEFRWNRFSFAITDFYGYNDFPNADPIFFYERNVDPRTHRPRVAGATGSCATSADYWFQGFVPVQTDGANPKRLESMTPQGIGVEEDCLKPGGAVGGQNENQFDSARGSNTGQWQLAGSSPQNALEFQSANQQLFAFICLGTVTIAAAFDPGACAWNIWGSGEFLSQALFAIPFSEVITATVAGEPDGEHQRLLQLIQDNTKDVPGVDFVQVTALRPLNIDGNDGRLSATNSRINKGSFFLADAGDQLTMDRTLTNEQRAAIGCGPFFGTRCDSGIEFFNPFDPTQQLFGAGGGFDPLNTEGSVLVQSFPGIEGTAIRMAPPPPNQPQITGWTITSTDTQPGTIGFGNDAYCTRYAPDAVAESAAGPGDLIRIRADLPLVRLPGCRGAVSTFINNANNSIDVRFEPGYDPTVDGCIFGATIAGMNVRAVDANGAPNTSIDLAGTCFTNLRFPQPQANNPGSASRAGDFVNPGTEVFAAQTLYHPFAGCEASPQGTVWRGFADGQDRGCNRFRSRDFETEFVSGIAQVFRNELAAWSFNFMQLLILTSCNNQSGTDNIEDPDCFKPNQPWRADRCGFGTPHLCRNVKGFLAVNGLGRNDVRAGGNPQYGRRDFVWHSGGQLLLSYERRNVFGFSMDFAEDVTKTNWGMEFTWMGDVPTLDNDKFDNTTDSQTFNLTVSVDRPTFINFLNANRTFFMNSQWFFQYLPDYEDGFTGNGPLNVLFTFAVFTGYYQDRLLPQFVSVYDFGSRSGGILPSVGYRFTEAFSVTMGIQLFFGRGEFTDMPLTGFAPKSNRAGANAYRDGTENLLSLVRRRDEAFLRVRWTF